MDHAATASPLPRDADPDHTEQLCPSPPAFTPRGSTFSPACGSSSLWFSNASWVQESRHLPISMALPHAPSPVSPSGPPLPKALHSGELGSLGIRGRLTACLIQLSAAQDKCTWTNL